MEDETDKRIAELEGKIDKILSSVEKTRKYFLWTLIITGALFVLPLIGLVFALPTFLSTYTNSIQGAGL
jgi:hypothetical protein